MAQVIHRESLLESDYKKARRSMVRKLAIPVVMIILGIVGFIGSVALSAFLGDFSQDFLNKLTVGSWGLIPIGFVSLIVVSLLNREQFKQASSIVKSGVDGEARALKILSKLPDNFTVIPDVQVSLSSGSSQMDFVIVGENGIWVVENKNMNGQISGRVEDQNWRQDKVGRGGTPYGKTFYNPIKQVSTHVFRLKEYLKEHGVRNVPWIQGVVFFSNDEADLKVKWNEKHPVIQGHRGLLDYFHQQSSRENGVKVQVDEITSYLI